MMEKKMSKEKPVNETVRMFKNPILESLTHIHPATPFVVFVPVVTYFFYLGLSKNGFLLSIPLWLIGVFLWTLLEYSLHRFIFHFNGTSKIAKTFYFFAHGVHHDYPKDATRLVMPLPVSIPLAFFFFYLFESLFFPYNDFIFSGIVSGYLAYDFLHYAFHHLPLRGRLLTYLKTYHLKHHYNDPHSGYGVSNPIWDYVFRTLPKENSEKLNKMAV